MIKRIYKSILIVQILSTFLGIAGILVDSLMVGQFLGEQSIAAYGLVSPLLLIFTSISAAIAVGAQNQAGEALGRGNKEKANDCYLSALAMTVLTTVICTILIWFFAKKISLFLGAGEDVGLLSDTVAYLRGYSIGIPGIAILVISLPFVQLAGDRKSAVVAAIVKTFIDILLDGLIIFVFKQGMFYVGLGSAISVYLADAYVFLHSLKPTNMFRIRFSGIKVSEIGGILKNGLPNGLSAALWTCMMLIMNRLALNNGGVTSVAALTIVMSFYNILVVNGTANSNTVAIMTSTSAAEFDYEALKEILKLGLHYSFWGNLLVGAIAFVFAQPIAKLYTQGDTAVLTCAVVGIRFISVRVINCPCGVLRNVFLGMKRLRITRIITTCCSFFMLALPAILFAHLWGMNGIWLSFVTADLFVLIGLYTFYSLRKGHIIPKAEDYLIPPRQKKFSVDDCLYFDIHSTQDVIEASKRVGELCKAHGGDLKTRLHTALAIEELGTNVITHGFKGQMSKNSFFKIRAFYKNEELVISIKDNANAFDITKYLEQFSDKVSTENIGIRLIASTAKKIKYTYTFGLNCLLVEV